MLDSDTILARAAALGDQIEACADQIEADRRLPDGLVEALRDAGVFRIAFPAARGGPEMDILTECRLVEQLAYHDASVAWVVMICSDSGHYAARLDEDTARELYPSLDLLTAGLLFPTGRADTVDGGYRVSGRWAFGSGCLHADRIVGGCMIHTDGNPVLGANGLPKMRVLWLPVDAVEIHDTWHTTGLAGSGSNDYSIDDVFVPEEHAFEPFVTGSRPETLYRYHGFFFANLPAVALGTATRMIDELNRLATEKMLVPAFILMKDEARTQSVLAEATARIGAARAFQNECLLAMWSALERGDAPSLDLRARIGLMAVHAVQEAHTVAEMICSVVGSAAIYAKSPFERRRRDLATLTAHVVGAQRTYQRAGQLLFGDEPPISFF
jgi:alkylation response protein AidB-like acyl-CoA dehydrogenase